MQLKDMFDTNIVTHRCGVAAQPPTMRLLHAAILVPTSQWGCLGGGVFADSHVQEGRSPLLQALLGPFVALTFAKIHSVIAQQCQNGSSLGELIGSKHLLL